MTSFWNSQLKNDWITSVGLPLKSKQNKTKCFPDTTIQKQDEGLVYFQTQMVSFIVNAPPNKQLQHLVILMQTLEPVESLWVIFNWKADCTVEKHSPNKHLHINKTLQNSNLEKRIWKSEKILPSVAIKWHN